MANTVFVALFGLLLTLAWDGDCSDVNSACKDKLTELDPHMDKYVGKIYSLKGKHGDDTEYTYTVGVCVDVTKNCAAVQEGATLDTEVCIGNTTSSQVARSADGMWIELIYTGGHSYTSHCNKQPRTTRIVFLCDPSIEEMGSLDFLEENNEDDVCYYLFTLASSAVCSFDMSFSQGLSVGDILLIIAAIVVVLWMVAMVIGCLYKRLFMGAKGWEQVPLLEFYREFGNLESDGCDLVCRSQPRKVVQYHEPTFGADTDESEEEKDDNLLPM